MGIETALIGSAIAGGISSHNQSKAAKRAAEAQISAANQATNLEREMWQQGREDMKPWLTQGQKSLSQLGALTQPGGELMRRWSQSDLGQDAGYQFRLGEGERGINRAMAARGMAVSGPAMRELARLNQGMASEEAMNAFNRQQSQNQNIFNMLSSLANTGQVTGNQLAAAGSQYAGNVASNLSQAANARASQYAAQAQAKQNMLGDLLGIGMQYGTKKGWF